MQSLPMGIGALPEGYTGFGMWWHTLKHGRGSEGGTGKWSG